MNINIKDLKTLLFYAKIDIESNKRILARYADNDDISSERWLNKLELKIETLEPIIEKIENELNDIQINIQ